MSSLFSTPQIRSRDEFASFLQGGGIVMVGMGLCVLLVFGTEVAVARLLLV